MEKVMIYMLIILILVVILIVSLSATVVISTQRQIIEPNEVRKENENADLKNTDCILVLGAAIWGNKPSHMLEDRLLEAIDLYKKGVAPKIIMSGDHGTTNYDEVNIMKSFAIEHGVKSEDIFMDHAGFATYESVYRAKEIFGVKKMIIVTQKYHLYRALYIANQLGVEAYGVPSNPREYEGQIVRDIREILARDKDLLKCIIKPKPTVLGESIPVSGNGDVTNDKTK